MKSAIGTKFVTQFGQSRVVGYQKPYRTEVYTSNVCEETYVDQAVALGPDDDSPVVERSGPNRVYSAGCPCCNSGVNHTMRVHEGAVLTSAMWRGASNAA